MDRDTLNGVATIIMLRHLNKKAKGSHFKGDRDCGTSSGALVKKHSNYWFTRLKSNIVNMVKLYSEGL